MLTFVSGMKEAPGASFIWLPGASKTISVVFYCPNGAITGISAAGASGVADGAATVAAAVVAAGAGEAAVADGTPGPTSPLLPAVFPGSAFPEAAVVLSGT